MGAVDNIRAFTKLQYDKLESIEVGAQKNDVDQIQAVLTTNLTLTGAEQHILFDTIADNQDITMPSNGIFEVYRDGYYVGELNMYMNNLGPSGVIVWAETRVSDLDPWSLAGGLMFKSGLINDSEKSFPINAKMNFDAGSQIRLMIKVTVGSITLEKQTESVTAGTLTQYPAIVSFYRAGNKKIV